MQAGVALVDIGGGTTDIAVYYERAHSAQPGDSHRRDFITKDVCGVVTPFESGKS
jgi:cell division ATPase FtsA